MMISKSASQWKHRLSIRFVKRLESPEIPEKWKSTQAQAISKLASLRIRKKSWESTISWPKPLKKRNMRCWKSKIHLRSIWLKVKRFKEQRNTMASWTSSVARLSTSFKLRQLHWCVWMPHGGSSLKGHSSIAIELLLISKKPSLEVFSQMC